MKKSGFILIFAAILILITGCNHQDSVSTADNSPAASSSHSNEEIEMNDTLLIVDNLNDNSDFGGLKLLGEPKSGYIMPSPNMMDDGSIYTVGNFDGVDTITQFAISSNTWNVYGLTVGTPTSEIKPVMDMYDFSQLDGEEKRNADGSYENVLAYGKGGVQIVFHISDEQTISKIIVAAITGSELNIDY